MSLAVETDGLTKTFHGKAAVQDLSLRVPDGCVFGFLGPNGAGKTTTMRLLLGLMRPDRGSIRIVGRDLRRARSAALASVGSLIERPSLYDHLNGRANLELTRILLKLPRSETDRVLEVVNLTTMAGLRVADYSLGMKQRLALARALLGAPALLLLDEPTNGLDADGIITMRTLIRELPERIGGTVFLSSHLLAEVEQVASMAALMNNGRLVLQESVSSLLGGAQVLRIGLDNAERGAELLEASGFVVMSRTDDLLRIEQPRNESSYGDATRVNRLLVEAGIGVHSLAPEPRGLEQVYSEALHQSNKDDRP